MFKKIAVTGCIALGIVGLSAAPAFATTPDNVEVFWAMPAGSSDTNVQYPQLFLADPSVLACGVWYQADTYLPAEAAIFTADGILNLGEDYSSATQTGAISWRFVYGGDCVVVVPPVEPPVVLPPVEPPVVVEVCEEGYLNAEDGSCVPSNYWDEPVVEQGLAYTADEAQVRNQFMNAILGFGLLSIGLFCIWAGIKRAKWES